MSQLSDSLSRLSNWVRADQANGITNNLTLDQIKAVQTDVRRVLDMFDLTHYQDRRLNYTPSDDIILHLVWSLKPGNAQIVAVCSSPECAISYRSYVTELGGEYHSEPVMLDHAFGRNDSARSHYSPRSRIRSRVPRRPKTLKR